MRIVTWNCRIGGFRKKAKHVAPLRPDILAVQEVEPLDNVLLFDGECQPTFRERATCPAYPRRSLAMFSYTETEITTVDCPDPENISTYAFRRYKAQKEQLTFNVAAVWTFATKINAKPYRQAHMGLMEHDKWIRQRPTVVLGDFNQSAIFKGDSWKTLMELVEPLGLVSAYHQYFGEQFGKETRWTHFHHGKELSKFHIDYCFLPAEWVPYIRKVEVGAYADWNKWSDHVPLIVDLDLPVNA